MPYQITVRRCDGCPFVAKTHSFRVDCDHPDLDSEIDADRTIDEPFAPPKWCPLRWRETIVVIGGV